MRSPRSATEGSTATSRTSDFFAESVRAARSHARAWPASGPSTFTKNSGSAHAPRPEVRTGDARFTTFVSTTAIGDSAPKTAVRPLIFTSYERVLWSQAIVPSRAATASLTRRYVRPSRSSARTAAFGLPSRTREASWARAAGAGNEERRAAARRRKNRAVARVTRELWRLRDFSAPPACYPRRHGRGRPGFDGAFSDRGARRARPFARKNDGQIQSPTAITLSRLN